VAAERFVADYPDHKGKVAFLITSDEEGPAHHGTKAVIERLVAGQARLARSNVGQPSRTARVGGVRRVGALASGMGGRRGAGRLRSRGGAGSRGGGAVFNVGRGAGEAGTRGFGWGEGEGRLRGTHLGLASVGRRPMR